MVDEVAIKVENLSKAFKLPHEKKSSIKSLFVSMFHGKRTYERQQVLKNISFEVKKGEFFGIVGRNGSGKSTLLKLLAGIYASDKGYIQVNGKLTPFIELGVGFNPELTGRENVFLNGALLGFNRKEMEAMYDEIVEFAELEKFMDQKLKNYSSGMQVRLAFSIAIRAKSDVLLIDEVLAVGDAAFQRKCFNIFNDIKRSGRTVVFVTHDMGAVEQFCERAILIDRGQILAHGKSQKIALEYQKLMFADTYTTTTKDNSSLEHYGNGKARIEGIKVSDKSGAAIKQLDDSIKSFAITMNVKFKEDCEDPIFGIIIRDPSGSPFFLTNTKADHMATGKFKRDEEVSIKWTLENVFNSGNYVINPAVADNDGITVYDTIEEYSLLRVTRNYYLSGPAYIDHDIKLSKSTNASV